MTTYAHTMRARFPAEYLLLAATLALCAIGLLLVCDTSFPMSLDSAKLGHDALYFGKQQAFGLFLGLVFLVIMMRIGYQRLRPHAGWMVIFGGVLLLCVWAPHLGIHENGAARWTRLGVGPEFQPSEIAKLTLILFLAVVLSRPDCPVRHLSEGLSIPLCVAGAYLLLIALEPDLGTAIVLFLTVVTVLYMAGARKRHLLMICMAVCLVLLLHGLKKGQAERVWVWLHPGEQTTGIGYQTHLSYLAIGSGEWTGVGWGQGREKYFIPQANSDYIFATVGEELGLIGGIVMMLLFGVVGWCGFTIARQTEDPFGRLFAVGITALISWQALINFAVVTVSIPSTGVPLPFISHGSTSLILMLGGIGLLMSIAQNPGASISGAIRRRY